jgi:hypothetical protein
MQDRMMLEKGVNWNNLETKYKRGAYVKRIKTNSKLSQEELDSLPEKHNARKNPDLIIERNIIKEIEYPIFQKITNKVGVIFHNEKPLLEGDVAPAKKGGIDLEKLKAQLETVLAAETPESLALWLKEKGYDIYSNKTEIKSPNYAELEQKMDELFNSFSKEALEQYFKSQSDE